MAPRNRPKRTVRSAPDDSALQRIAARRVPAGGDTRSLAEVACDEIRKAIREGRVATGAHLTEVDLASWLGMSRTPIREAMRRLESEGLLLNQPFRGALVMRLDADDMRQMFAVRELLEPAAAAACAMNAGPAEIAALRAIIDLEAAQLDNPAALIPLNRQFHDIILESARNQFLSKAIAAVYALESHFYPQLRIRWSLCLLGSAVVVLAPSRRVRNATSAGPATAPRMNDAVTRPSATGMKLKKTMSLNALKMELSSSSSVRGLTKLTPGRCGRS